MKEVVLQLGHKPEVWSHQEGTFCPCCGQQSLYSEGGSENICLNCAHLVYITDAGMLTSANFYTYDRYVALREKVKAGV